MTALERGKIPAPRSWDSEELILSGDQFFARVFSEVAAASRTVEVETYIFDRDAIGARAEAALAEAARGGARVRLLVDGIGARAWIGRWSPAFAQSGVEVRIFHPLWPFAARPPHEPEHARVRAGFLRLVNRRNHRKTWIVNGDVAYVGSMNVSANHSESERGPSAWRDAAVRVEGGEIALLRSAFEHAWARARTVDGKNKWTERLKVRLPKSESLVRLNFTKRLRRRSFKDFLARLRSARRRAWIVNPYLVPGPQVLRAIRDARAAGADVKILVPRSSDVFFMRWVATAFYRPLARAGAEIYEYLPRFVHQKSVIVDDWAAVGTSNMNTRSLLHDLEVDVVLSHADNVRALAREFEDMLQNAARVDLSKATLRDWIAGALGRAIAALFKNWI